MEKTPKLTEQILEDSVLVGILEPFPEITAVIPEKSLTGRVHYRVIGDVKAALEKLYKNNPVGSLDVLRSIKSMRQAIFSLKGKGNRIGENDGSSRH